MNNWDHLEEHGVCSAQKDMKDAELVCKSLRIPFKVISFVKDYWNEVFISFIREYEKGRTPNPDILCNKQIKFGSFIKWAMSNDYDYIATGHYAGCNFDGSKYQLIKAKDVCKDQTYFLSGISSFSLSRVIFPLSKFHKLEVKEICKREQLHTYDRPESMGICFIGKRNFKTFLQDYLHNEPGNFLCYDSKRIVGTHLGISYYTIGQGAKISGATNKWVVLKKDTQENAIHVVPQNHPALLSSKIFLCNFNWIAGSPPSNSFFAHSVIRSTDKIGLYSLINIRENGVVEISILNGLSHYAVAPGQTAVLYKEDVCLGGGIIESNQ